MFYFTQIDAFVFLLDAKNNLFDFSANWANFALIFYAVHYWFWRKLTQKYRKYYFVVLYSKMTHFYFYLTQKNLFDFSANWRNFCGNFLRVINVDFDANWRKNNADLILFDFMQKWRILHINRIVMKSYRKMDAVEF